MEVLVEAGVDIVEVGVPYSDPLMDGPVIQHAAARRPGRRRARSTTSSRAAARSRAAGAAAAGHDLLEPRPALRRRPRFAADLAAAGGAGLITPDLIPDEAGDWIAASDAHGLDRVFLVAPSSTAERLAAVTAPAAASSMPRRTWASPAPRTVVGDAAAASSSAPGRSPTCRSASASGCRPGSRRAEVAAYADGVIVGSALVRCLTEAGNPRAGASSALRGARRAS